MPNVVVTGASRGLGLQIASTLAAAGYRVIAIARSPTPELEAAATGAAAGGTAAGGGPPGGPGGAIDFRPYDLANLDGMPEFVHALRAEFGTLYGLVNNAGLGTPGVLGMMPDRGIEQLFRLNAVSPIVLTKHVLRSMMGERAGRIVNISSIVASSGYAGVSVYSATKASLIGFTRSLAREVGQLGITVNAIAPGFVDTAMTGQIDAPQRARIIRRSALRRMVEPVDIARSVEFLLGEGGRNITGAVLTLDAGTSA